MASDGSFKRNNKASFTAGRAGLAIPLSLLRIPPPSGGEATGDLIPNAVDDDDDDDDVVDAVVVKGEGVDGVAGKLDIDMALAPVFVNDEVEAEVIKSDNG